MVLENLPIVMRRKESQSCTELFERYTASSSAPSGDVVHILGDNDSYPRRARRTAFPEEIIVVPTSLSEVPSVASRSSLIALENNPYWIKVTPSPALDPYFAAWDVWRR